MTEKLVESAVAGGVIKLGTVDWLGDWTPVLDLASEGVDRNPAALPW